MTDAVIGQRGAHLWRGVIEEYRDWIELPAGAQIFTLGEGGTPLVESPWLSELVRGDVYLKVEGVNPTGSFKDRGMTTAITIAAAQGAKAVVCASTGNTSASMTAYAARARLTSIVLVPHGRIAAGKLAQAVLHGAEVVQLRGGFDECLQVARELSENYPVALVNSVNPTRLEGQKTAAFELVDELGEAPDIHVLPVGNAGNITAYWLGFRAYAEAGIAGHTPQMWGFQASGSAPIVRGEAIAQPDTVATAIRVGNPASWRLAVQARDESGGRIEAVTDEQILAAQRDLGRNEGIFVEPGSAASVAGLVAAAQAGQVPQGKTITITVTGHGLKDIETAMSGADTVVDSVLDADVRAVAEVAGL